MARWKPLVRKDSYMPNNKMTPLVIGNGYTTDWGANGLPPVYETVTGNPVSFSTVQAAPLHQLSVAFSPVQSGTGDPSPDNVRPISGWDSLTVYHSGADTSDPQTISITIGSTVYSGTVDVLTGVVTVDKAIVDIGTLNFDPSSPERHIFRSDSIRSNINAPTAATDLPNAISSSYKSMGYGPIGANDNGRFAIGSKDSSQNVIGRVVIIDHRFSTQADFVAWVSGQTLCYELKAPFAIQLTPQQVSSLLGENNVWSTANGDLTVEYRSN